MSSVDPTVAGESTGGVHSNRAEFGVAVLLAALGIWALVDAAGIEDRAARGFVTAKTVPMAVGAMLVILAILLVVDLLRGGHGELEGGEDVDLSHGADWKTVALLAAAFAFNAAFVERLGWPITGAVMFFLSTIALGGRHWIRTAIISIVLSVASWYLFFALDITLPLGLLDGVL